MLIARAILHSLFAAALLASSYAATASVTTYSDRTSFSGLGSISYDYGFEDIDTNVPGSGGIVAPPGPTWTTNGITYDTAADHLFIVGPESGLPVPSKVLTSNLSNGGLVTGAVSGSYDLFGFDLGTLLGNSTANISLTTNLGTYSFSNLAVPQDPANSFFGFKAGAGEHFTAFSIANTTDGTIPSVDNVTLGIAALSPVPEPEVFWPLLAGLFCLRKATRRQG